MKKSYENNKLKISRLKQDEEFEILDVSYSTSDIQEYFEYIIKKQETLTEISSVQKMSINSKQNYIQI